jgi:transposase
VARELGVRGDLLRKWRRQFATTPTGHQVFPGNGNLTSPDEEVRRLRRELAQVREERDILKKATAFFAKESR